MAGKKKEPIVVETVEVSVGFSKTIQEEQFEPINFSVRVVRTVPLEDVTATIQEVGELLQDEVADLIDIRFGVEEDPEGENPEGENPEGEE